MKRLFLLFLILISMTTTQAQQEIPLYPGKIPNSLPVRNAEKTEPGARPDYYILSLVSHPTLSIYLPAKGKANGTAVIICPGGGYVHLAMAHEGIEVARLLNEWGITAFVLKYRLPDDSTMADKTIGPLQDAQRAIQLVRQNASRWGIDTSRIGILGFSAGGHLASTAGTHFEKAYIDNKAGTSLRPDFMILAYPVISFSDSIGHRGSRDNLLGKNASPEMIHLYSNETQVNQHTPPTFLLHAGDDDVVPVANSIQFYQALQHNNVPTELIIYPHGGHGFGLHNKTTKELWQDRLKNWLDDNGWLNAKSGK